MRQIAAIAIALLLSTPAAADECFDINNMQEMTLRGTIMQSRTLVEEEGQPPHKYLTLVFDQPLCILGILGGEITGKRLRPEAKPRQATFIEVISDGRVPIKNDWIGHHVEVTATVLVQVELNAIVHRLTDVPTN